MKRILKNQTFRFSLLAAFLAVMMFSGKFFSIDKQALEGFFSSVPVVYSAAIFLLLYVASDFINWVLKDILKIVGAFIFGAFLSSALIYVSEIINACIFFRMSTYLGRGYLEQTLKGRSKNIYQGLGNLSFAWIVALRMVPLIPFRIMDMGFGLSKISFPKYIAAVVLASPLRIFWIQFILASLSQGFSVKALSEYLAQNPLVTYATLVYFIIACIVAVMLRRKFK